MPNKWRKTLLNKENSMKDVLRTLDKGAQGIVLVIDNNNKLYGTITDGDVRRAILNGMDTNSSLESFIQKKPIVSKMDASKIELISIMKNNGIIQLPIVDQSNKVIGLKTLKELLIKEEFDNPVFIMAGGFGKRLQPLTNSTPKPMLNINGKPILEIILSQFINYGFKNFYISTFYKSEIIKNYFKKGEHLNVSIKYVEEDKPLGTAGALRLLPFNTFSSPIIMMNGDLITKVNINNFLTYHYESKSDLTIGATKYEFEVPYGVIQTEEQNFKSIVEKPKQKFFVNAGIYIIDPKLIASIAKGPIDMPTWINKISTDENKVNIFPIFEYWVDIGNKNQLEKVKQEML